MRRIVLSLALLAAARGRRPAGRRGRGRPRPTSATCGRWSQTPAASLSSSSPTGRFSSTRCRASPICGSSDARGHEVAWRQAQQQPERRARGGAGPEQRPPGALRRRPPRPRGAAEDPGPRGARGPGPGLRRSRGGPRSRRSPRPVHAALGNRDLRCSRGAAGAEHGRRLPAERLPLPARQGHRRQPHHRRKRVRGSRATAALATHGQVGIAAPGRDAHDRHPRSRLPQRSRSTSFESPPRPRATSAP